MLTYLWLGVEAVEGCALHHLQVREDLACCVCMCMCVCVRVGYVDVGLNDDSKSM